MLGVPLTRSAWAVRLAGLWTCFEGIMEDFVPIRIERRDKKDGSAQRTILKPVMIAAVLFPQACYAALKAMFRVLYTDPHKQC